MKDLIRNRITGHLENFIRIMRYTTDVATIIDNVNGFVRSTIVLMKEGESAQEISRMGAMIRAINIGRNTLCLKIRNA